jgi:uncharacterized protein
MASVAAAPFDAGRATTPDQPAGRISSLDFIRGIAVVGILWANIVGYARPREAYRWQAIFYEPDWTDNAVWLFQYVFVDGKLRGLFALLFGAGIVLFLERARAKGASGHWLQFRRLAWLALFGLAHYFVLYAGDILFHYAVLGMIARWAAFSPTSPRRRDEPSACCGRSSPRASFRSCRASSAPRPTAR